MRMHGFQAYRGAYGAGGTQTGRQAVATRLHGTRSRGRNALHPNALPHTHTNYLLNMQTLMLNHFIKGLMLPCIPAALCESHWSPFHINTRISAANASKTAMPPLIAFAHCPAFAHCFRSLLSLIAMLEHVPSAVTMPESRYSSPCRSDGYPRTVPHDTPQLRLSVHAKHPFTPFMFVCLFSGVRYHFIAPPATGGRDAPGIFHAHDLQATARSA